MYGDKKTKHDRINREPQVLELKKWQLWALTILVVIALLGAGHFDFQAVQMGLI